MIRPTKPEDAEALIAVAKTIGFEPNEIEVLRKMLADYLDGNSDSDAFGSPTTMTKMDQWESLTVSPNG